MCDYGDAYIFVKGTITVEGGDDDDDKKILKNNAPFRSSISKIYNTFINNAEDLDIAMPMYNLLENSDNYSMTSGSLWNYYRDKINDNVNENNADNNRINNEKTVASKYFEYKTKLIGSTPNNSNILDAEVVVPPKYLSNFWRSLDLPLINHEIEFDLSWSKECAISEISLTLRVVGNPNVHPTVPSAAAIQTTRATFQINNAKLYVLVVTLSINDNIKFLGSV